jgi:hypothetical protein
MNGIDLLRDLGFKPINSAGWKSTEGRCRWFKGEFKLNGKSHTVYIDATGKYFRLSLELPMHLVEESFMISFEPTAKEFVYAFSKLAFELGDQDRMWKVKNAMGIH